MCHPCVWIRHGILYALPVVALFLLWHVFGIFLFIVPAVLIGGALGFKHLTAAPKSQPRATTERVVYRDANSPLICLPCEREGKAIQATNVLAIQDYEIPCCTPHLRIAESRAITGGVYRGR